MPRGLLAGLCLSALLGLPSVAQAQDRPGKARSSIVVVKKSGSSTTAPEIPLRLPAAPSRPAPPPAPVAAPPPAPPPTPALAPPPPVVPPAPPVRRQPAVSLDSHPALVVMDALQGGGIPSARVVQKIEVPEIRRPWIFSPLGPGEGNDVIGMGGRVYLVVPSYDVHWLHGFTDKLDFKFDLATLGLISVFDAGVRYRVAGSNKFSFGLYAGTKSLLLLLAVPGSSSIGGAFAVKPGATVAFGSDSIQFSIDAMVPIVLLAGGINSGSRDSSIAGFFPGVEPAINIEFGISEIRSMYIRVSGLYFADGSVDGLTIVPIASLGAAW